MGRGDRAADEAVRAALADAMVRERMRIVAGLIRVTGDWDLAEDAVADAAERALLTWPRDGVPANPAAWLTTTARNRAVDVIRRADTERARLTEVAMAAPLDPPGPDSTEFADDRLRLIFTCCHPALPLDAQVALTLKVVCGRSTSAIARAFLVSEATMGQRLLRAKQKIAHAGIPYRTPEADMWPARLNGVLSVVYLVFTEGWSGGADPELADEGLRLARLLADLMPGSEEARALLALLLVQHSRRGARVVDGELVTLEHQDRSRWDAEEIAEAFGLLAARSTNRGRYRIEAELAAVHAVAVRAEDTDWPTIVERYDELRELHPSPVVELNRAIAVGMADGARAGLAALDRIADPAPTSSYLHLAARADLLVRAGDVDAAVARLCEAAELAPSELERRQIRRHAAALLAKPPRG